MAIKAIARLDDVDAKSVKLLDRKEGTIGFDAQKGKSIDLAKVHAALNDTRLSGKSGRTGARIHYLEITTAGEVTTVDKDTVLKVTGTQQTFVLLERKPEPGEGTTPLRRLKEALQKGEKVTAITGRVDGWNGHFPKVLSDLSGEFAAKKVPLLFVTGFETAKE